MENEKGKKLQVLAINPTSGYFYFRQSNGGVIFTHFADDDMLCVSTEEGMRVNISQRDFTDFRGDPEFAFESLAEMKAAIRGVVAAHAEARRQSRLTGRPAFP